VHDRRTGTEERVGVRADGTPSPQYAMPATLSADGTRVAFRSFDDALAPGEAPDSSGLYVRDLDRDVTLRLETAPGTELHDEPVISPDGGHVAYVAAPRLPDGTRAPANAYLYDLRTGTSRPISESVTGGPVTDAGVRVSAVTEGARHIGFGSGSAQLVADDGSDDGFVRRLR